MIQKSLALAVAAAAFSLTLGTFSEAGAASDSMKEADRNGDTKIDRGEFHARMTDVFYAHDKNRDGFLVLAELNGVNSAALRKADRDGDDKLSLQEYINARFDDFHAADQNRDGLLNAAEVEAW